MFLALAYFWLLLGVLFRLPHLKKSTEFAAAKDALAQPRPGWIV
jgi:hypothetical protein